MDKYPEKVYTISSKRNRRDIMVINVTDSAKEQLKQVKSEKENEKPLRIYVAGYG